MNDPHNSAAEAVLAAVLQAQRDVGDVALCEALDRLALGTGESRFRYAANVIRGTKLGRHAIDDLAALRRVTALQQARGREAVSIVARQVAGPDANEKRVAAISRRLRRKLRENETDKLLMSVSSIA